MFPLLELLVAGADCEEVVSGIAHQFPLRGKEKSMKLRMLLILSMLSANFFTAAWAETDAEYDDKIEKLLRAAWSAQGHKEATNPAVDFTIEKDGSISNLRMEKSSGDTNLDNQALALVKKLAPFGAPPKDPIEFATVFKSIDYAPYMTKVQNRIKQDWVVPNDTFSSLIVARFNLARNGTVSDITLDEKTGVAKVDDAAIEAVKKAAPFDPLPAGTITPITIQFTFDLREHSKNKSAMLPYRHDVILHRTQKDLNNEGVTLLMKGQYQNAIERFALALKEDPEYEMAKDNLAIAFNNLALQNRESPSVAVPCFCRSLYLRPDSATTRENLIAMLTKMEEKKASTFDDFVHLGDDAASEKKSIEAYVFYKEALRLKPDTAVEKKASDLELAAKNDLVSNEK
jgi:TonB family protein